MTVIALDIDIKFNEHVSRIRKGTTINSIIRENRKLFESRKTWPKRRAVTNRKMAGKEKEKERAMWVAKKRPRAFPTTDASCPRAELLRGSRYLRKRVGKPG